MYRKRRLNPRHRRGPEGHLGREDSGQISGSGDDVTEMNQLSGGQKALVALAQIFAIQRS